MRKKPAAPFTCKYTSQLPELLYQLGCTLAISTYQAGKVIFLSATNEEKIIQLPRSFEKPMGIAELPESGKLAIACKNEVIVFANSPELAQYYPKSPNKYDALYMPRVTYHTGPLDIHDLRFGNNDVLYAVNTMFSCIITIDENYNFTPFWKPSFVSSIDASDRCHLNGMVVANGKPKYATAFNQGDQPKSWRENITSTGVLIDIETDKIVLDNLAMPHSPRLFDGELYILESAIGMLSKVNVETKEKEELVHVGGFVRGMDKVGDYLFVAASKLRKNSSTFAKLKDIEPSNEAAITVIHLPTKSTVGKIKYEASLDEIYDVHILKDKVRPNIMNTMTENHNLGVMMPNKTFWGAMNKTK